MGGGVSTDFKSLNRIKLSQFIQVLLNFYWLWGVPPWGWVGGWLGVRLGGGNPHTYVHTHACMCTHMMCTHTHIHMLNMLNMAAAMVVAIFNFLTCWFSISCVCMWACMCVHVWGQSPCPRCPHTHLPPPQSCREPKSLTVNKYWTNWDNLILFENSLPLNTPELI